MGRQYTLRASGERLPSSARLAAHVRPLRLAGWARARAAGSAARARDPERRDGPRVPAARGTAAAPARARAARRDARRRSFRRATRSPRPRARGRRPSATPRRSGSADSIAIYEGGTPPRRAADCRDAGLAAVRSIVCVLRHGARARHRTAAAAGHGARLEPGADRRPVRVPDRLGSIDVLDRARAGAARHPRRDDAALPRAGRRRTGVRADGAIRGSSGSIRAGTRRRGGSSSSGFVHILDGTDHLLFLLCLVIPFRRLRPLVLVVTAFTVAHSITLIASAFGLAPDALWFPPLVETLIAASIVYMALENIVGSERLRQSRWMIAFGVRPGARLRVLVRAARDAAVRRLARADVAARVQRRRRARADPRARSSSCRRSSCCSATSSPSASARSSCRRSSRTRRGTG